MESLHYLLMRCHAGMSRRVMARAAGLGLSAGLTTLLAAESTGAQGGLGMRIRSLQTTFETGSMLAYIIIIGIIGLLLNLFVDIIERRLTSWQERREE